MTTDDTNLESVLDKIKLLEGVIKKNKDNPSMIKDVNDILGRLLDYLTNDYSPIKKVTDNTSKSSGHGMGFDLGY